MYLTCGLVKIPWSCHFILSYLYKIQIKRNCSNLLIATRCWTWLNFRRTELRQVSIQPAIQILVSVSPLSLLHNVMTFQGTFFSSFLFLVFLIPSISRSVSKSALTIEKKKFFLNMFLYNVIHIPYLIFWWNNFRVFYFTHSFVFYFGAVLSKCLEIDFCILNNNYVRVEPFYFNEIRI